MRRYHISAEDFRRLLLDLFAKQNETLVLQHI